MGAGGQLSVAAHRVPFAEPALPRLVSASPPTYGTIRPSDPTPVEEGIMAKGNNSRRKETKKPKKGTAK